MEYTKKKIAYVVFVNSDGTEGRGYPVVKAVCDKRATALRLAKGADVQGSNGQVLKTELLWVGTSWFGPVTVVQSTVEDDRAERRMNEVQAVIDRGLALGLTPDEIAVIRSSGAAESTEWRG
mgnify:CR=1 FL=1